jgi:drug/metabolite transporter (DMT)-like permease
MLRTILEGILLFALPFIGFALYLKLAGHNPLEPERWSRQALSWLTIVAVGLCIVALVWLGGVSRTTEKGSFVPSHVGKDGQFVPGQFKN